MGRLIGITQPDWSPITARRSAPDEIERYARYELGDEGASSLLTLTSRIEAAPAGCEREPHDWTLLERLTRAVASFF